MFNTYLDNLNNLTFCMLKPDVLKRRIAGEIINRIEKAGFSIVATKQIRMDQETVAILYKQLLSTPFYKELMEYTTSGPVILLVLQKENAPSEFRNLIGSTDPKQADINTIRRDFGISIECNSIHGSESSLDATREIFLFFNQRELFHVGH